MGATDRIVKEVVEERSNQNAKWGVQNHDPFTWLAILGEEFGESCKAAFETNLPHMRKELIQVAAVAVAIVECLDRKEWEVSWREMV